MTTEVDALYALPLDEFTKARDALAKSERDPSIRKLRKPSAAAWALNQARARAQGRRGPLPARGGGVARGAQP